MRAWWVKWRRILAKPVVTLLGVLFYCEYLHYFIVLWQCSWPKVDEELDRDGLKVFVFADTHLLGSREGHWFDKLRREWEMRRAYATAMFYFRPDLAVHVGDAFDEGKWSSDEEFDRTVKRFDTLFPPPRGPGTRIVAAGNHDTGAGFERSPRLRDRFDAVYGKGPVRGVEFRGIRFIVVDSMALDETGEGTDQIQRLKREANPAWGRPVLITHYPLFRVSDANCSEPDEAPANKKNAKFRQGVEALRVATSNMLLNVLQPRLVFNGHSHHGCRTYHERTDTEEWTLSSFSWRNKNNPSFSLLTISPRKYALAKCYIPEESTVIQVYIIGGILVIVVLLISIIQARRGSSKYANEARTKKAKE